MLRITYASSSLRLSSLLSKIFCVIWFLRVYPEINRLPSYFLHQPSSEANIRFQGDYLVVWDKLAIFVNGTFDEERLSEALNTGTRLVLMTQEEKWQLKYNEVMDFIEKNHRNPSKHNPEERGLYLNWINITRSYIQQES